MGSDATDPGARDDEFLDKTAGRKEKTACGSPGRFISVSTR